MLTTLKSISVKDWLRISGSAFVLAMIILFTITRQEWAMVAAIAPPTGIVLAAAIKHVKPFVASAALGLFLLFHETMFLFLAMAPQFVMLSGSIRDILHPPATAIGDEQQIESIETATDIT
ncbi:MAG: hypothetical protein OWS74_03935 [Firmicutes bacterium]|nr:hypothetical protein [Bacillota bacterium]